MPTIAAVPMATPAAAACAPRGPVAAALFSGVPAGAVVDLVVPRDYGHIRYAEATGSPAAVLAPNVTTPFVFTIDPSQTQDFLKAPFAGALAFDGTTITPRKLDDALFVEVNLIVTSMVAGGFLRLEIDVGSPLGPIGGFPVALTYPPGQAERVTFPPLFVQVLSYFVANGARLSLTSTVPVSLVSEAVILVPSTAAP